MVSKLFAVAGARVSRGDGYGQWNTSGCSVAVLGFHRLLVGLGWEHLLAAGSGNGLLWGEIRC